MDYSELDPLVVPMVKYFNENGLKTIMSCQGHNKTNLSMFWIQFDESVTSEDIQEFMRNHLDDSGWFPSDGRFARRMYCGYSRTKKEWHEINAWCYFAATPEAANEDLGRWKSRRKRWKNLFGKL